MKKTVIKRRKRVPAITSRGSAGPGGDALQEEPFPFVPQAPVESKPAAAVAAKPKRGRKSAAASKAASAAPSPPDSTISKAGDVDMDADAAEAERAAQEGVCDRSSRPLPRPSLTNGISHSQAAHQLAAETLLSIGPNSRSTAAAASSGSRPERPSSVASTNTNVDPSLNSLDARGLKRKGPEEEAAIENNKTSQSDSPKRRAYSPAPSGAYVPSYASSLASRHAQQSIPRDRPVSIHSREADYLNKDIEADARRRQQQKLEDDLRAREREIDKERSIREAERERDRRGLGIGRDALHGDALSRSMGASDSTNGSLAASRHALAGGSRPSPFKYGGSMFDHDRFGYGRAAAEKAKEANGPSSNTTAAKPSPWNNPLTASQSRPSSPMVSPAQSKASIVGALTRKELQDHRDSLLEGKKWLEERLSKTERLLAQLSDKLAESPAVTPVAARPVAAQSPASSSSTASAAQKEEDLLRARQARERELINSRRSAYGGLGFGSGSGLLGGGYGSPYGGGLGLLRMSEWDSWSRDKPARDREREKEREREREREKERDRERDKDAEKSRHDKDKVEREKAGVTPSSGSTTNSINTPPVERKPTVAPLGTSIGLARRKEVGGMYGSHGGNWSMA